MISVFIFVDTYGVLRYSDTQVSGNYRISRDYIRFPETTVSYRSIDTGSSDTRFSRTSKENRTKLAYKNSFYTVCTSSTMSTPTPSPQRTPPPPNPDDTLNPNAANRNDPLRQELCEDRLIAYMDLKFEEMREENDGLKQKIKKQEQKTHKFALVQHGKRLG